MISSGSTLGGYRVDGLVGRGATATVYAATQLSEARRVALKVLAAHLRGNSGVRDRFRETALAQQALRHPSILEVHDVVESGAEIFLVTPLVEGTLAALIADGALTPPRTARILVQIADALDFAHGEGTVHGDVTPRNILVSGDGAYLSDFGLASAVARAAPGGSASGPGTIGYSAPERLRGEPPTPGADRYSLACVLFECLTGELPFAHETAAAIVGGHLYNAPPRPSAVRPGVPPELDEILASGLAKDPGDRPASARELLDAAAPFLDAMPPPAVARPAPRDEASRPRPLDDTLDDPLPALPAPPEIDTAEPSALTRRFAFVAAAAVVAAGIAGVWLGQRPPGGGAQELELAAERLVVDVPGGWKRSSASRFRGWALEGPLALVPSRSPRRVTFLAGLARVDPPAFLPATLHGRGGATPRRSLVHLDGGVAYRYADLPGEAGQPVLRLFVLPGPRRSAVAACAAAAAGPVLRECTGIARTLRARGVVIYDPTPDRRFAAELNSALRVLRVARRSGLALLGKAASRRAQARSATEVAVAYRTTAASVRRARPTSIARMATEALVEALDRAGVGYTRLAGAARLGNADGYDAARGLIARAEAEIRAAHADIAALGYGATT